MPELVTNSCPGQDTDVIIYIKYLLQKLPHRNWTSAFLMIAVFERKERDFHHVLQMCCLMQMLIWILKAETTDLVG